MLSLSENEGKSKTAQKRSATSTTKNKTETSTNKKKTNWLRQSNRKLPEINFDFFFHFFSFLVSSSSISLLSLLRVSLWDRIELFSSTCQQNTGGLHRRIALGAFTHKVTGAQVPILRLRLRFLGTHKRTLNYLFSFSC
jgi:hypothetical protein